MNSVFGKCRTLISTCLIQPHCAKFNSTRKVTRTLTTVTDTANVRRIKLNDPENRNALSTKMLKMLKKNLTEGVDRKRCIVLCADGPVFSSGHNLKELASVENERFYNEVFSLCSDCMTTIRNLPIPVIAEVKGIATAAGFQLVASCDIVVAADTALFSTPGANVGLFCSTPGVAVARSLPNKVALYLLLTGDTLSAEKAYQLGFVSELVPADQLEAATDKITKMICSKSRKVIEVGKTFYYKQLEMDLQSAYRNGTKVMTKNLLLDDGKEGIDAFLNKRSPSWSNF